MIYFLLFITFFQIGLFGFGGGYGMLSLIQSEVVNHYHWMTAGEFADIVAISQMTPGPIGINSATYCGYTAIQNTGGSEILCIIGSITATFALVLPSIILMLCISMFFMRYKNNHIIASIFQGIRPVVVGLVFAAFLILCNTENFSTPDDTWKFVSCICLFIATFVGIAFVKISTFQMLLLSAIAGILLFS